jgi:hypothetical protein
MARKSCVISSGRKKGKLKKGWRYGKRGNCIKAKGAKRRKRRKSR